MTSSTGRLPRLLSLVPYLLARPGIRVTDAARDFDVTEAQLRRDLELLWVCGLPGHGPGDLIDLSFDDETVTVTYDAGMSRPLTLTADEALALIVALRALAEIPDPRNQDAVGRALAKIESAAGKRAAEADAVAVRLSGGGDALPAVRAALDAGTALHLTYYVATRDESTERDVDPMRLLFVEGSAYLEAWCRLAEGVRLFRLDRIDAARELDEPSRPPATAAPRDLTGGLYQAAPDHPLVTLRLTHAARWITDYYPCEWVRDRPDGGVDAALRVTDPAWVRRLLLRLGSAAEVLDPPWLADQVRQGARRALRAYERPAVP